MGILEGLWERRKEEGKERLECVKSSEQKSPWVEVSLQPCLELRIVLELMGLSPPSLGKRDVPCSIKRLLEECETLELFIPYSAPNPMILTQIRLTRSSSDDCGADHDRELRDAQHHLISWRS